ncbi:hypothetical protein [Streptomyces corynorhini]|uniref:hypothetical protein n=1 Tax=Streptomyces corynorhini TaxID=2282652 RepID=UPI001F2CBC04|nr:hypothetical protein [Streptomyces corynorhini]
MAGQPASSAADFALLPAREAAIASFIDRLPDGADISVKALAKVMDYGQCALRTALNFLQRAGHLLRKREHVVGSHGARWVTRTWFSRAARSDGEWSAGGDASEPVQARDRRPTPPPERSRGYALLASLGRRSPVLSLSSADCAALEPLVVEWFGRGAGEEEVLRALAHGLPSPVHHPAGLVRSRLVAKLPPRPADSERAAPRVVECAKCRAPARPEALVGGECGVCRGAVASVQPVGALSPERVRARAAEARAAASCDPAGLALSGVIGTGG